MGQEKPVYELKCFVSSSFTDRLDFVHRVLNEKVAEELKKITSSDRAFRHRFSVTWNRLDEAPYLAENIQKNVLDSIRSSHFLVADITPQF